MYVEKYLGRIVRKRVGLFLLLSAFCFSFLFSERANAEGGVEEPDISGSFNQSTILKEDGTVWTWGLNSHGQLGNGTSTNSFVPVQVKGLDNVIEIASGSRYLFAGHNLALKSDQTVWAWGSNDRGELGNGTTQKSATPVKVPSLTNVIAIARGGQHSLALKSDGTVWAWGYNTYGQLGNGSTSDSYTPVKVSGLTNIIAIAGGHGHSLALKSDGTVWAWGYKAWGSCYDGQIGDGTMSGAGCQDRTLPIKVAGLTNVEKVSAGNSHTLAIKTDGTVWTWGRNDYGQLGDGSSTKKSLPVQVPNFFASDYFQKVIDTVASLFKNYPELNNLTDGVEQQEINDVLALVNTLEEGSLKTRLLDEMARAQRLWEHKVSFWIYDLFNGSYGSGPLNYPEVTQNTINDLKVYVDELNEGDAKTQLTEITVRAQAQLEWYTEDQVNQLFADTAHTWIRDTTTQDKITAAGVKVDELNESDKKQFLKNEVQKAQGFFNLSEASKAINSILYIEPNENATLLDHVTQEDINRVKEIVSKVTDQTKKERFIYYVNIAQQQLEQRIGEAVSDLFKDSSHTLLKDGIDQNAITGVKTLVSSLNNSTTKTTYLSLVNKAQELYNALQPTSGWLYKNGTWFYVLEDGTYAKSKWILDGGKWYFLTDSGAMAANAWVLSGGKWYYMAGSGEMVAGRWIKSGGTWYYLSKTGEMLANKWLQEGSVWYYLTGSGAMATGWKPIGGKWYYFYSSGVMAANTTIDGYKLGSDGAWIQ